MLRQIYIVSASQVVTSDSHPEGLFSVVSGYPKTFDSRTYAAADGNPNGDAEKAYRKAEADYLGRVSAILDADNPARAMATITLERADGVSIQHRVIGKMPDLTPAPEPAPEPEPEPEPAEE